MAKYTCPECGGNDFAINPEAFLAAKGRNVKNLPVTCRSCGFEAKPNDFKRHKKKRDEQKGFTIMEVLLVVGALGLVALCGFLIANCRWFTWA